MASEDPKRPQLKAKRTFLGLPRADQDSSVPPPPAEPVAVNVPAPPSSSGGTSPKSRRPLPKSLFSPRGTKRPPPDDDDGNGSNWAMPAESDDEPGQPHPYTVKAKRPKLETKDYANRHGVLEAEVDSSAIVASPVLELGGEKRATIPSLPPDIQDQASVDIDLGFERSEAPTDPPKGPMEPDPLEMRSDRPSASPVAKLLDEALPDAPDKEDEESEDKPLVNDSLLVSLGAVAPPDEWPGVDAPGSSAGAASKPPAKVAAPDDEGISRAWLFGAALAVGIGVGIAYFATRSHDKPASRPKPAASAEATSTPTTTASAPAPAPEPAVTTPPEPTAAPSASVAPAPSASASAAPKVTPRPRPYRPGNLPDIYEP